MTDISDHETHITGTISAVINGQGVVGVAPEVKLLIVKVMEPIQTKDGIVFGTTPERIIKGIKHCINWRGPNQERVRVINMSFGSTVEAPGLHDAVKDAVDAGILMICAAGNEGDNDPTTNECSYPANFD